MEVYYVLDAGNQTENVLRMEYLLGGHETGQQKFQWRFISAMGHKLMDCVQMFTLPAIT